jgi:hypothetical protein
MIYVVVDLEFDDGYPSEVTTLLHGEFLMMPQCDYGDCVALLVN